MHDVAPAWMDAPNIQSQLLISICSKYNITYTKYVVDLYMWLLLHEDANASSTTTPCVVNDSIKICMDIGFLFPPLQGTTPSSEFSISTLAIPQLFEI